MVKLNFQRILQQHELDDMGLGHLFGPARSSAEGKELSVAILKPERNTNVQGADVTTYTAQEDIKRTLPDGRQILELARGQSVPMAEAVRRGYVKPKQDAGPTERKPKQGGPAEQK